jgi:hypothetical protein
VHVKLGHSCIAKATARHKARQGEGAVIKPEGSPAPPPSPSLYSKHFMTKIMRFPGIEAEREDGLQLET